jgi:hypothetical protein
MRSVRLWCGAVAIAALVVAHSAHGGIANNLDGHVSVGYSTLFVSDSLPGNPGGNISFTAGLSYPIQTRLRIGVDLGFAFLGSRTIEEGSAVANLDYSMFDSALLLHWEPGWKGPIARISVGPTLGAARAELSTSGGGLAFTGLAVEEIAPGAALDVTLMAKPGPPVRAGVEIGIRHLFLEDEDWTVASLRLAIHY